MNRTIEDIQKEINKLNIEKIELANKVQDTNFSLNKLKNELKMLKDEELANWYKNNPLQKYYKKIKDEPCELYVIEEYINIEDKTADEYNRSIVEMAKSSVELNIEYFQIFYNRQGKMESLLYQDTTKVATWQFAHQKDNKPGEHGIWTVISKDEFDEIKKKATEYIINNNIK